MKRLLSVLMMSFMLTISIASAEDGYISDELFTYMHSGPGSQYRIIGSVNAGTKITQLKSSANYTQIKDNRGREGWIETKFITSVPSLKIRFPELEAELAAVKSSLEKAKSESEIKNQDLLNSLTQRTERVKKLENQTTVLNQQLLNAQSENRQLRARIDTQKEDLLMRYFTYGALVAGAGLLLGLLLPILIPKRKNKNGWA